MTVETFYAQVNQSLPDFKLIPLSKGYFALVDEADYERLSKYKWCVSIGSGTGVKPYAIRRQKLEDGRTIRVAMHREIMSCCPNLVVDHLDNNPLNNRKVNLECITPIENTRRMHARKKAYVS
jgi:hypothetical protein